MIIGQMGVGKSTTGLALAAALRWQYADSDEDLGPILGMTGADYAWRFGVPALHRIESAVLLGALTRTARHVITAAASVVENPLVREVLPKRALVVRLDLDVAETRRRQAAGRHRRPMSAAELEELVARREEYVSALADLRLDARLSTPNLVADILSRWSPA